jgi:aspartyl-tRNA(Asn)/glutamyl-tRNA(Gln) amidotransferase subunit B
MSNQLAQTTTIIRSVIMQWEPVIGIEVHVQLNTQSKIFSGASTAFGAEPNTQACAIDLGLPGVLPVLNKEAVKKAITFGLAVNADITNRSVFARKNYFYPDLPKGYQISQHDLPIVGCGSLEIELEDGVTKTIGITRAHLEEDAGKSLHEGLTHFSGVDLNRAGTPLLEIVSEPDMRSAKEVLAYLKTLHQLVRYLDISDANMQEGSFRCDVNISLRQKGTEHYGTRAELKNMNSFKFIERAIACEIERQSEILDNGGVVSQETRAYDVASDSTRTLRSKENAPDYRYFPDPDLLPVEITQSLLDDVKNNLPELPRVKRERLKSDYQLNDYDAAFIANNKDVAHYFEATLSQASGVNPKIIANWIAGELSAWLNKNNLDITQSPVSATRLAGLLVRVHDNTISNNIAKQVFETMWSDNASADEIIEKKGLKQITDDSAIIAMIDEVIANSPQQLADYRAGKDKLFSYFVGQVMKAAKGKANPVQLNALLKERLK